MPGAPAPSGPTVLLRNNHWMTSEHTGCWYPAVQAGEQVTKGQPLGELRDYFGETLARVEAPADGVVLFRVTSLAIDAGDPLLAIGSA